MSESKKASDNDVKKDTTENSLEKGDNAPSTQRNDAKNKVVIEIDPDETVDEIVSKYPAAERYLLENDIECMQCSEPFWGSLDDLVTSKGKETGEVLKGLTEFLTKAKKEDS